MDLPVAMMSVSAGWLVAGEAESPKPKVEQLRLDNGLTVLVRPVQGARRAALVVLYNIGGGHDPKGQSGLEGHPWRGPSRRCGCQAPAGEELMRRHEIGTISLHLSLITCSWFDTARALS